MLLNQLNVNTKIIQNFCNGLKKFMILTNVMIRQNLINLNSEGEINKPHGIFKIKILVKTLKIWIVLRKNQCRNKNLVVNLLPNHRKIINNKILAMVILVIIKCKRNPVIKLNA